MSGESSDDSSEVHRAPPAGPATSAIDDIANLSDDDSDDGRVQALVRTPTSPRSLSPDPKDSVSSNPRDEEQVEREPSPPREVPSVHRNAGVAGARYEPVDMLHFPPNITLVPAVTTKLESLPHEQNPILYRLRSGLRGDRSAHSAVMHFVKEKKGDPLALAEIIESNARIITWSDGSRTLAIGSTQFLMIADTVASKHLIFRQGDDVQTCEARVKNVMRVQPSSTTDARTKLAMATAAMKAASKRPEGRTMLRCMDDTGEQQEAKAKVENNRKQRERARLEARRRQSRERQMRPKRPLTVDALERESDDDSGEDHARRMAERFDAERLMRAKRAPPPRTMDVSVKRRKAGGRRVLGSDDEDSEESY